MIAEAVTFLKPTRKANDPPRPYSYALDRTERCAWGFANAWPGTGR